MNISLVSCSESLVNPFSRLERLLAKSIADAEFSEFVVPRILDIPKQAKLAAKDSELVVVFALLEKADFRQDLVLEKLVEIELGSQALFVKVIESIDEAGEEAEDEAAIAKRLKEHIMALLFPKESSESLAEEATEEAAEKAAEEEFAGEESEEEAAVEETGEEA